jgi:hypothetical protein
MVPQKQPVKINFAGSIDQKTDPFQVGQADFLALNNSIFTTDGRLTKRNGFPSLGKSVVAPQFSYGFSQIPGTMAAGRNISAFQNELVLNDGLNLYSYAQAQNNWIYKGRAELCSASSQSIYKSQYNNIVQDSALNSTLGIKIFAWEAWTGDPNKRSNSIGSSIIGVEVAAIDYTTGQTLFSGLLSSTASHPKCVSISNKLYVVYFDSNDNKLYAQEILQSGPGATTAIITNIDSGHINYDLQVVGSNICIAYAATGPTVKVALFSSALVAGNTTSKVEFAANCLGLFTDTSNNVWVAFSNGTSTKVFAMDSTLTTTVMSSTTIDNTAVSVGVEYITGVYDVSVGKGIIFFGNPGSSLPGQPFGFTAASSFVQPAVNASVNVTLTGPGGAGDYVGFTQNNQIIYIPTGGYYWITSAVEGSGTAVLTNTGYGGNAIPGATVAGTTQIVYPTTGYQNAVTYFNTLTLPMTPGNPGTAGTLADFIRSVSLASKAFTINNTPHVILTHDSNLQPTYFVGALYNTLAPVPNAAIVAKLVENIGGGLPLGSGPEVRALLPSVNVVSAGVVQCALLTRTYEIQQTSNNTSNISYNLGIISEQIDFTTDDIQTNQLGSNLNIGSGAILAYDGASVVEQGFHLYPETVTAVASGSDGSLGAGTYGYLVVYQWVDNQGQTHESAPLGAGDPLSIVVSANNHVVLTIPTLRLTEKQNVTIAIYRTAANGSTYFRLDVQYFPFPINNSVSSDTVTFTDYSSDASISGNSQIYTQSAVPNIAAPASNAMTEYKNRLIVVPSENPYEFWYSQQVITEPVTGIPVEFSNSFIQNVSTVGGALKGVTKLDDKLILFKDSSIYYMTGTGPSPSGANSDFTDPQFVTSDVGLVDMRSIVTMPMGLIFKSTKGIYLLDRSLQASYVGARVEGYNQYSVLFSQLIPNSTQIRFLLSNGTMLMYDYYFNRWGTFSCPAGISSCVFGGVHTYLASDGTVYKEAAGTYYDGVSTSILMSFTTSWIKLAGLQGYQRAYFFYLLAEYISAHQLSLSISYDFSASSSQTTTITPSTTDLLENWRVFLAKQRCQSFQIALQEIYTGTPGAAFTMSGLNLIAGVKSPFRTISAAQSAG